MSIPKEILDTLTKFGSLEARTADVAAYVSRVEVKIDGLIDRLARLEAEVKYLKENVKTQIMGDLKADFVRVQSDLNYQKRLSELEHPAAQLPGAPRSTEVA